MNWSHLWDRLMEEVSTSSLSSILSFSSPSSSLSNSPPVSLCPYHSLSSFSLSHTPPPSSGGEHAPHRRGGGVEGGQIYKRSSGLQRQAAERHRQTHWLTWATYLCSERARVCVWMWPRVCDKDTVVTAVRWWHQDPPQRRAVWMTPTCESADLCGCFFLDCWTYLRTVTEPRTSSSSSVPHTGAGTWERSRNESENATLDVESFTLSRNCLFEDRVSCRGSSLYL